jgi:hypothetical protein
MKIQLRLQEAAATATEGGVVVELAPFVEAETRPGSPRRGEDEL